MALAKFTVDTVAKLFIAKAGVVDFDVKVDLYSDAKEHWITDDDANGHDFPFGGSGSLGEPVGGNDIDTAEGTQVPTYVFLRNGWRIRPDEADHTLKVTGGILLVFGGGDPFVDTLGAFTVRINYQQPVQAIVAVSQGVAQVTLDAVLEDTEHLVKMTDGQQISDPTDGKSKIADPDDDTPYREAAIFEDYDGVTPYGPDSEGIERRDKYVEPTP